MALPGFGSLGGGGRYDDLIGEYARRDIPATGVCIGLSRVQEAMTRLGLLSDQRRAPTTALVLRFSDSPLDSALSLTRRLRSEGVSSEVYPEDARFKKQVQYAERKGIPYVLIQRGSELESGTVQVKNIATGEQVEVAVDSVADHLQR
jgi:histidyl-tRNA synthetase